MSYPLRFLIQGHFTLLHYNQHRELSNNGMSKLYQPLLLLLNDVIHIFDIDHQNCMMSLTFISDIDKGFAKKKTIRITG